MWFWFCFISAILPYRFDEVIYNPAATILVSQITALWLVWFRGTLPSFQKCLYHKGTSVTWWTWTQHSPKLLSIVTLWFQYHQIPHLSNWWSNVLIHLLLMSNSSWLALMSIICRDVSCWPVIFLCIYVNIYLILTMITLSISETKSVMLKKVVLGEFRWCQSIFLKHYLSDFGCSLLLKYHGTVSSRCCYVLPLAASMADFFISGWFRQQIKDHYSDLLSLHSPPYQWSIRNED